MTAQRQLLDVGTAHGGETDFWATPPDAVDAIQDVLLNAVLGRRMRFQALEPAAGEGALIDLILTTQPICLAMCEVDPSRHAKLQSDHACLSRPVLADFLTLDVEDKWPGLTRDPGHPLLVVMNPPWTKPRPSVGREFVQKCLDLALPSRGIVLSLLQLDWCTGVEWSKIHEQHPCSLYPLKRRPKFNGQATGTRPAAWFLWDLEQPRREWRIVG